MIRISVRIWIFKQKESKTCQISSSDTWPYLQIKFSKPRMKPMDTNQFGGTCFDTLQLEWWCKCKHILYCLTNDICLFWSTQPCSKVMTNPRPYLLRFKECDTCYCTNLSKPQTEVQRKFCLRGSTAHSVFPWQTLLVINGWFENTCLKNNLSFRRSI